MRIAQLAPLAESVPPKLYGGTERVVAWLVDELVELGHDVTLFASGDSRTKGKLHAVWPRALRLGRRGVDPNAACVLLIEAVAERARDFDVMHSHVDWLPLPVLRRTGEPFLTTMHGRLDLPGLADVIGAFPEAPFVSISANQRHPIPDANWIATIHHGLPKDQFRASCESFSRTADGGKGTGRCDTHRPRGRDADADRGQDTPSGKGVLQEEAGARNDGEQIKLVGQVDEARKEPFLAGAAALLFPIDWPEPFGLVMIEAMACGTPVIAYRSGSVPEVVEDGITGFVVDGEAQAIEAVKKVDRLDRSRIRARFEERFAASRVAREYEDKYRELVDGAEAAAPIVERASAK